MSGHWRLALRGMASVLVLAAVVAVVLSVVYGVAYSGAFLYGVAFGALSLLSTALTVTLLTGRPAAVWVVIGAGSFFGRFGFAAVVLGVPAYFGLWPTVPMLAGFAGVYVAENVVLLPALLKIRNATPRGERRVEA